MEKTKKICSLRENRLFIKSYKKGLCYTSKTMSVYVMKNYDKNTTLLGLTVSKSMGNAVKRNKIKRKIRESYRSFHPFVKKGFIIVIVSKKTCAETSFETIREDMYSIIKKAGLLV